jgi:hypothetical protein
MPAAAPPAVRLAVCAAVLLLAAAAAAQPTDPPKLGPKQPDGTYALSPAAGDKVLLTPEEHAKLLAQIEQLKKELAARKPATPGGCAIRGKIEKRGDALVAALKLTVTFRAPSPGAAVVLGGKRAFLVAASLDGGPAPALDTADERLVAVVEKSGDHTLSLDLECPVAVRPGKTELGFDLGLPRAAITTLALDPPPGVGRVTLTSRIPDAAAPGKAPDVRRGVDVKQMAAQPGRDGYPLGAVDYLDVSWEPPAVAAPVDTALTADWEIATVIGEGFVETTAKLRGRGSARTWKVAAPADAVFTADRVAPAADGSTDPPTITRPPDGGKAVWSVAFPPGASPTDWVLTAVVRSVRPKTNDTKLKGQFAVGPFALLDAARQTGTLRVGAAANTRLTVRHGPEVRQDVPPAPVGDEAVSFFRFATGPTGVNPPPAAMAEVEARPTTGLVEVRPTYRLTLTDGGWRVRAELKVAPVRRDLTDLVIDVPADWRAPAVTPPEVVDGVEGGPGAGPRRPLTVRLAAAQKQPFELVLTATVPVAPAASSAAILLPRFPGVTERDAAVVATVPDGFDVRAAVREWDGDQPAGWGQPLAAAADPKGAKAAPAVAGRFDAGLARLDVNWSPFRPELAADLRADVSLQAGQVLVTETLRLRAPDGFGKGVRLHTPAGAKGLKATPPLDAAGSGEWAVPVAADAKEVAVTATYALPVKSGTLPVGLLWPANATRVESVVRVWNGGLNRAVGLESGPWRELPAEPVPGKDVLPLLTLAGSGADLPLSLAAAAPVGSGGVLATADRGFVQVWLGGDGTATARARFALSGWLTDSVALGVPPVLAGTTPELLVDGKKVEVLPGPVGLRVPLPEARPGRVAVVDLRYRFAHAGGAEFLIPELGNVALGPVRLQVTAPPGGVPLVAGGRPNQRWALRGVVAAPFGPSAAELEAWFLSGAEPSTGDALDAAVTRVDGPVRVAAVPLVALVAGCSAVVVVLGLFAVKLPGGVAGPLVTALAAAVAVAAVLVPQPAGLAAAAGAPGLLLLALTFAARFLTRRVARRRITQLPGFARGRPVEEVPPLPTPSARPQLVPTGSTGELGAAAHG